MFFSPIEQFESVAFIPGCYYSVLNTAYISWIGLILGLFIVYKFLISKSSFILRSLKIFFYFYFSYFFNLLLLRNYLSELPEKTYLRWYTNIFLLILVGNVLGLFPYVETITASLVLPLFLSLMLYVTTHILVFGWTGFLKFFSYFMPSGVPFILRPFIAPIELLSHLLKVISLGVRLFANMFSGHVLLHILAGTPALFLADNMSLILFFVVIFVVTIITIVFLLETFIALLQACVFVTLSAIYCSDFLHSH